MANPTGPSMDPALLEAVDSAQREYVLDKSVQYTIEHTALQDDGSTEDTHAVVYNFSGAAITATYEEGASKGVLASGKLRVIGPGHELLSFKAASGGAPIISITPVRRYRDMV